MKHPRMRPTRGNRKCQNVTGPCGALNVIVSISRGGKLRVKTLEKMSNVTTFWL